MAGQGPPAGGSILPLEGRSLAGLPLDFMEGGMLPPAEGEGCQPYAHSCQPSTESEGIPGKPPPPTRQYLG